MDNQGYLNSIIQDIWSPITFPSGYYSGGRVQVDPNQLINLTEINIREGITLFGVTGTYSGGKQIEIYCNQSGEDPVLSAVPNLIKDQSGIVRLYTNEQGIPINSNNRFSIFCHDEGVNFNLLSAPTAATSSDPVISDIPVGSNLTFHVMPLFSDYNTFEGYIIGNCRSKVILKHSPNDASPEILYDSYLPSATIAQVKQVPDSGGVSINYQMIKPIKVEFRLYENTYGEAGLTWEITIIELSTNLYDTSTADPNNGGASPEDVAAGKIFFNNTGSHNGTLIKTVITQNAETGILTIV
jgi:hypothetical protein